MEQLIQVGHSSGEIYLVGFEVPTFLCYPYCVTPYTGRYKDQVGD